jgi:hypothetical protein
MVWSLSQLKVLLTLLGDAHVLTLLVRLTTEHLFQVFS